MLRIGFLLGAVIAIGALSACGGDGGDAQAPQAGVTANAGGTATGATGTTGSTSSSAPRQSAPAAGKESESARANVPPREQADSQGIPTGSRDAGNSNRARKRDQKKKKDKDKQQSAWSRVSKRKLYRDARISCRVFGLRQVATEYNAKSLTAADAAEAYADAFIGGGAPKWTRKPTYDGCVAGLTGH